MQARPDQGFMLSYSLPEQGLPLKSKNIVQARVLHQFSFSLSPLAREGHFGLVFRVHMAPSSVLYNNGAVVLSLLNLTYLNITTR